MQSAITQQPHAKQARISATELQRGIGSVIRRAYKDHVHFVVERGGLPVIAILSFAEYEALVAKRRSPNHTPQD